MNAFEYRQLQAERTAIERLLDQIPSSSVIERLGLESRKRDVEDELASQTGSSRDPVRAKLTFRGKPVIDSHGMFAEFGAAVVNTFAEAVAAIGASRMGPLGSRGAIANRDDYRLLITGTALGSFGFELEEAPGDDNLFPELSPVALAIDRAKTIMEASLGTDDDLTEAISDLDPRALEGLRTFLKTMADQDAVCTLEFKGESFRFADVGQVLRSEQRLRQDNIHEEDIEILGEFLGVLPKHRTFEFLVSETQDVISGKVGPEIEDAGQINLILTRAAKIRLHAKHLGTGRPRFVLLSYEDVSARECQDGGGGYSRV